jgi:hypothetical protein
MFYNRPSLYGSSERKIMRNNNGRQTKAGHKTVQHEEIIKLQMHTSSV